MKKFCSLYFEVLLMIGIILGCLAILNRWLVFLPDFIDGFCVGFSITMIIFASIKKFVIPKDCVHDEREEMLVGKSFKIAYYCSMIIAIIGVFVFGLLGEPYVYISITLSCFVFIENLVFIISKLILSKKY